MVAHSKVEADNAVADRRSQRLEASNTDRSQILPARAIHNSPGHPLPVAQLCDTHFRTFRSQSDFIIITKTSSMLDSCGFYWGPMMVNVAHEKLRQEPVGTFLIRDSRQKNCFFAISVKTVSGPISIRIHFQAGRFSLDGSKESFNCLFQLVEHYLLFPKNMLSFPLRKVRLRPLQELCRKSILATFGRPNLDRIPVNRVLKDYLKSFPFQI
ncbi:PREDICTED: suppressor of cytokine signaling 1 [Nanorana parkeri]|uniref:suppressor of cytokine signaling 1 n=1 Tax=Nanorana parkeri TaxID=125878 RepID=UPI00085462F7|nr:PREDICTED: suppressor of cytokine signaling 1 [Nanorana parkeri]